MGSLSSKNENIKYLLCIIINYYKLWVDQGREFFNKLMQEWLGDSTQNVGKIEIAERFIKTLKAKIF